MALEERIGDVCTGLSEETILKQLKQRKYWSVARGAEVEVEPCCICQVMIYSFYIFTRPCLVFMLCMNRWFIIFRRNMEMEKILGLWNVVMISIMAVLNSG